MAKSSVMKQAFKRAIKHLFNEQNIPNYNRTHQVPVDFCFVRLNLKTSLI